MTSSQRVWLTQQAHDRLREELAGLLRREGASETDRAAAAREDQVATTLHQQETRIRQIQQLLAAAVVGEDPPDDGIAEPGMVLTIQYDDTAETETFLLGLRDAELNELEVYSPSSPLGTALTGARRGEQRSYQTPSGTTMRVTLLDAIPYGHHRDHPPAP